MGAISGQELGLDLFLHADYCRCIRGDKGRVDGGSTIGHIVRQESAGIVGGGKKSDPVGTV